jgi:hypothetical protein
MTSDEIRALIRYHANAISQCCADRSGSPDAMLKACERMQDLIKKLDAAIATEQKAAPS